MRIWIPSFHGDVNLEKSPKEGECFLRTTDLTEPEKDNLLKVLKKYDVEKGKRLINRKYVLPVSIEDAHKHLLKELKGDQVIITAFKVIAPEPGKKQVEEVGTIKKVVDKAKDLVSTVVPRGGCPPPPYDEALAREIRATRVLNRFLTPTQSMDFRRQGSVMVYGGDTGDQFLVSHRHSKAASRHGMVKNVTTGCRTCVHHSHLPAPEEVLALLVALQCREKAWLRHDIP